MNCLILFTHHPSKEPTRHLLILISVMVKMLGVHPVSQQKHMALAS